MSVTLINQIRELKERFAKKGFTSRTTETPELKTPSEPEPRGQTPEPGRDRLETDAGTDDIPIDLDLIVESSKKLLDINQGLAEPDKRDSLAFAQALDVAALMRERVRMDAGRLKSKLMRKVRKAGSLKRVQPGYFNTYAEGYLLDNPLSSPGEEINPMQFVEQATRFSRMGLGGLPSDDSITEEAQNIEWSEFGFLDLIAGPESSRIGVDTRLANGVRIGSDNKLYQRFRNPRTGKYEWKNPGQLFGKTIGIPT